MLQNYKKIQTLRLNFNPNPISLPIYTKLGFTKQKIKFESYREQDDSDDSLDELLKENAFHDGSSAFECNL